MRTISSSVVTEKTGRRTAAMVPAVLPSRSASSYKADTVAGWQATSSASAAEVLVHRKEAAQKPCCASTSSCAQGPTGSLVVVRQIWLLCSALLLVALVTVDAVFE